MGQCFISRKSSKEVELTGNMTAGDLRAGKTGYSTDPENKITGTIADKGAWSSSVEPGGSVTIPAGIHNGSGKVKAVSQITKDATNIIGAFFRCTEIDWNPKAQSLDIGWGTFCPKDVDIYYWLYSQDEESGTIVFTNEIYGILPDGSEVVLNTFDVSTNAGNGDGSKTIALATDQYFKAMGIRRKTQWKHRLGSGFQFTVKTGKIKI